MNKTVFTLAAILGFLSVAIGAFGAHGLQALLKDAPDAAQRISWFDLGARYHLIHSVVLLVLAVVYEQLNAKWAKLSAFTFVLGIVVFSGSLYAMGLSGEKMLGRVTPIGGGLFLVGWMSLAVGVRARSIRE
jgi:uncharacterized membrane protein YgdD (TMEM256/DUF423 family)